MKNVLMLIVALVVAFVLWRVLMTVVHVVLGWIMFIAMIALFCWLVYAIFKLMTREKSVY